MKNFSRRLNTPIIAIAAAAFLTASPAMAQDHVKLFLLGGQSNMVGTGTYTADLPLALQSPQSDVYFYTRNNPVLTTLRPGSGQQFGPEVTFGRTIANGQPGDTFGLVKYAISGADLTNQWDPNVTGNVYEDFRTHVTAATTALTNAGHTYEFAGMLWTQGERDARVSPNTYEADLNEFIADIRSRYGTNLPFLFNQLSVNQTDLPASGLEKVRNAQQAVADADPSAYMIDTDSMTFHDDLHFDSESQIALGESFGNTYLTIPEPTSLLLMGAGGLLLARRQRRRAGH